MYDTILFDFDGTLTPSLDLWLEAYQYALTYYNINMTDEAIIEKCFFLSYEKVVLNLGLPPTLESAQQFEQLIEKGLAQAFTAAKLFPMVAEILESCKEASFTLGVVTSSSRSQVTAALHRLGITDYFNTVVSADDVTKHKPHPEPVQLALSRLERRAEKTLFVGDSFVDVLAGHASGTHTALFMPDQHARFYDFDYLRATKPDFIFTHHEELLAHLKAHSF